MTRDVGGDLGALERAIAMGLPGREEAAEALALAVAGRVHALLLGPPGCGKSRLAERCGEAAGARCAVLALHRDVREDELVGPARLLRTPLGSGAGERMRLERLPGPLLAAEVAVLDDLDRAPGEALGALRRVLDARRLGEMRLPLECAVATAGPPEQEGATEPLEPGWLDRFTVQVRLRGVLAGGARGAAREVLAGSAGARAGGRAVRGARADAEGHAHDGEAARALDAPARARLQRAVAAVAVPSEARAAWLELAGRLAGLVAASDTPGGASEGLVSDRFLGEAVAVLRAHALRRGAEAVAREDLRAVRHLLAARIPEARRAEAEALVDEAARGPLAHEAGVSGAAHPGRTRAVEARVGPAPEGGEVPLALADTPRAGGDAEAADVARLVRALAGRIDRPRAERGPDPGGLPRRRARMRRLDELADADAVETLLWLDAALPGEPGILERARRARGGTLAILRDVSASMEGRLTLRAGAVVAGLVREAARRRMRVGYVEFHHEAEPFRLAGRLFHRRYPALLARAARARAEGRTSYEAPLRVALEALRGRRGGARHAVLLTDGVPVVGDPRVGRERRLARELGVRVHTVYMGPDATPELLRTLARETGGGAFRAAPVAAGRLAVRVAGEPRRAP